MSPIEIATKAQYEAEWGPGSWDLVASERRKDRRRYMRTALRALAETELGSFDRAVTGPSAMRTDASDRAGIFRAVLRSIANEGKTDG